MGIRIPCDACVDPGTCELIGCIHETAFNRQYSNELEHLPEDDIELNEEMDNSQLSDEEDLYTVNK